MIGKEYLKEFRKISLEGGRKMKRRKLLAVIVSAFMILSLGSSAFAADNLILNGSFELGNQDFLSDYDYVENISTIGGIYNLGTLDPEKVYAIGTDPSLGHKLWTSYSAQDGEKMMIVNAKPSQPADTVWSQEVTVPECDPIPMESEFPLYAGQDMLVGKVYVKSEDGKICVRYELNEEAIDDDWLITEIHVAIGDTISDIPQANGNPSPGLFGKLWGKPAKQSIGTKELFPEGVVETPEYCLPIGKGWTAPYVVAAHAVVEIFEVREKVDTSFCIVSDEATLVGTDPATLAWVHPNWNYNDSDPDTITTGDLLTAGAKWIWNSYRTTDNDIEGETSKAITGEIVEFNRPFFVDGTATKATLAITADNGYAFKFNSASEVEMPELVDGWRTDFTATYVPTAGDLWKTVEKYDVLADILSGNNTLYMTGVNEYMGPLDGQSNGTADTNPGGLLYKLCIESYKTVITTPHRDQTAWGGTKDFPGKNWATFISYTPEFEECSHDYEFSFYAANSHPDNPAVLEVFIDGESIGDLANLSEIEPLLGTWEKYTFDVELEPGNHLIEIVDTFTIAQGDDFSIDNIRLEKK